ncbi:flagellar basal-body rod modification protein FlgD [Azospirillum agricola]|uniref:flagellar hook assembly protein FlgD n=1 Tax=Azospirillum agricola TaxID=1720247 RepID=UPI001AE2C298|nr:flagellar hook assembly protein FlgD [Azospirillum agricola]MBP2230958.1 flagellar basal-body rod modification protein FlgD [Azospirillum agricola]
MSVSALSSTYATSSTATASSSSSRSSASLAENYQSFLTLLLKQLEVQDPTDPVDASEYTSQLVQLASLEQQMSIGDKLDDLTTAVSALGTGSSAIGYLGRTVEAEGDTTALQDGSAEWEYDLDSTASKVTLTVTDSSGKTVYTTSGETSSGTHALSWDGTGSNGSSYTSGTYTLAVTAFDSSGSAVGATTRIKGTVTGVDSSSGSAVLDVGGVSVSADDVLAIS